MSVLSPSYYQDKESDRLSKVAIVGRGFTGIMTAIALLKGVEKPFHLVMFDPRPKIDVGEGVYQSAGVLSSRVRDLSVCPDEKDDFRHWLETDGRDADGFRSGSHDIGNSFVPQHVFSSYVYKRFSEALQRRPDVMLQFTTETVTAVDRDPQGGFSLFVGADQRKHFDAVFLATGYGLRESVEISDIPVGAKSGVVIGGSPQAVDRALSLLEEGKATQLTLISESGLLPQSHTRSAVGAVAMDGPLPQTLRGVFRFLREAARQADAEGLGWQGIMNWFRTRARRLWCELTPAEQQRFKRHVKAIYDSHRNRLPPEHYDRLHQMIGQGAIRVRKARVERIATNGLLLRTPSGLEVMTCDFTIDCRFHLFGNDNPVIRSVLLAGLAKSDGLELGIVADESGRTVGAPNTSPGLFAMGPLGLGSVADIDLVPQIVVQAHAAAALFNNLIDGPAGHGSEQGRHLASLS